MKYVSIPLKSGLHVIKDIHDAMDDILFQSP